MEIAVRHFRAAPPWRRIAIVVGIVAAVELVLLVVAGVSLIAKPVQTSMKRAAVEQARTAPAKTAALHAAGARHATRPAATAPAFAAAGKVQLPRARTAVLVLNGIGKPGAAGRTAERMRAQGYRIDGVTNAARMDYTRTTIMYRPGFGGEAARLGRDLKVPLVGPLDGMRTADLGGAQLVVIVGR